MDEIAKEFPIGTVWNRYGQAFRIEGYRDADTVLCSPIVCPEAKPAVLYDTVLGLLSLQSLREATPYDPSKRLHGPSAGIGP